MTLRTFIPGDNEPEDHVDLQDNFGRMWMWEEEDDAEGWWTWGENLAELRPFPHVFLSVGHDGHFPTKLTEMTLDESLSRVKEVFADLDDAIQGTM